MCKAVRLFCLTRNYSRLFFGSLLALSLGLSACGSESTVLPASSGTTAPVVTSVSPVPAATIEITLSTTSIKIGEEATITGSVKNMGVPAYSLFLDKTLFASDKSTKAENGATNATVEFVSVRKVDNKGVFVLRGVSAGKVQISLSANGEVAVPGSAGNSTVYNFSNTSSNSMELVVS